MTQLILIFCFSSLLLAASIVLFSLIYQKRMSEKELVLERTIKNFEIELFKKIVEAQEQEKENIAKDMHDDLGPRLTFIKLNLTAALKKVHDQDSFTKSINDSIENIDMAIDQLRSLSHELSPSHVINYGLIKALSYITQNITDNTEINCDFHSDIVELDSFDKFSSLNIYRLFNELMNNILKHANPKNISITFSHDLKNHHLDITHDGNGLSQEEYLNQMENPTGLGIKSIASRIFLLNGSINFIKSENKSEIRICIPITNEKN